MPTSERRRKTRSQKEHDEDDDNVSTQEEPPARRGGRGPSKQGTSMTKDVLSSKSDSGKKRTISNADQQASRGLPPKKVRAAAGKSTKDQPKQTTSVNNSRPPSAREPQKSAPSGAKDSGKELRNSARQFKAPEEIDVNRDDDDSDSVAEASPKRKSTGSSHSKAKPEEEIDIEDSEEEEGGMEDSDDDGEDEEDDGKRNDFEKPVWHGRNSKQSSHGHGRSVPAKELFDDDDGVEFIAKPGPPKLRRKADPKPMGKREQKLKAEQPGWNDEDDDLGHPERKPEHRSSRSRKSESRSKKSSRHRKATGTCPDSNEDSDESDSDPTSIVYRNGRVPVLQQSALLRSILASATNEINKYAMTENFYPLGHELDKRIRKALHNAASQSEAQGSDRVAQLLKKDDRYGQDLGSVVRNRFGALRCDVRDFARSCVPGHYQLGSGCSARVQALKHEDVFLYAASDAEVGYDKTKPYQHEGIVAVLRWFFRDRAAVGSAILSEFHSSMPESSKHQEPEIPAPLLAFAATMVYAELDDWKTGTSAKPPFRADVFASVYKSLFDDLIALKKEQVGRYHRLTSTVLKLAVMAKAGDSNPRISGSRFLHDASALPDIDDDV